MNGNKQKSYADYVVIMESREGEKCRPLDHMKEIPFIHQLCLHTKWR